MQINTQTDAENISNLSETLKGDPFRIDAVQPLAALLIKNAAVFKIAGKLCAADARCSHLRGSSNQGTLHASTVTCPWQGSGLNDCARAVPRCPAREPVKTFAVNFESEIGRVEIGK